MSQCPSCRRMRPLVDDDQGICPHCGHQSTTGATEPNWVPVARITNLADVGYFEDILAACDIESVVQERDDFDALAGSWQQAYVIRVREEQSAEALAAIRGQLDAVDTMEGESAESARREDFPTFWKPLALMVVAVGMVYVATRDGVRVAPAQRATDPRPTLWDALAESTEPFATRGANGAARRRVYHDPKSGRIVVEEDIDHDGRFERRRDFFEGELVRDTGR